MRSPDLFYCAQIMRTTSTGWKYSTHRQRNIYLKLMGPLKLLFYRRPILLELYQIENSESHDPRTVLRAHTFQTISYYFFPVQNKTLTFKETDVCSAHQMRESVYYYLCYTVLFQFLPVGRPVIQSHDGRYAPLPKPKQSSLIRNDKL